MNETMVRSQDGNRTNSNTKNYLNQLFGSRGGAGLKKRVHQAVDDEVNMRLAKNNMALNIINEKSLPHLDGAFVAASIRTGEIINVHDDSLFNRNGMHEVVRALNIVDETSILNDDQKTEIAQIAAQAFDELNGRKDAMRIYEDNPLGFYNVYVAGYAAVLEQVVFAS